MEFFFRMILTALHFICFNFLKDACLFKRLRIMYGYGHCFRARITQSFSLVSVCKVFTLNSYSSILVSLQERKLKTD